MVDYKEWIEFVGWLVHEYPLLVAVPPALVIGALFNVFGAE